MADLVCTDICLWVKHVGCRQLRIVLLSLDPGSKIWLSLDGDAVQFERMQNSTDGSSTRGFKPVGETALLWLDRFKQGQTTYIQEVEIIERPLDTDAAGEGFYRQVDAA